MRTHLCDHSVGMGHRERTQKRLHLDVQLSVPLSSSCLGHRIRQGGGYSALETREVGCCYALHSNRISGSGYSKLYRWEAKQG